MNRLFLALVTIFVIPSAWGKYPSLAMSSCQEALITIKPMMGFASSKQQGFDVRIVSQWGGKSQWSNQLLMQETINRIARVRADLNKLGFSHGHYLNVLVEKHPGAISSPVYGRGSSLALGPFGVILTPNIFGFRSLFFGDTKRKDTLATMPRTLVLEAMTAKNHALESHFTVAHELAHDSEPEGSPRSLIWIEARADFLAFAVSGESEIRWPNRPNKVVFDDDGSVIFTNQETRRSLKSPRVERLRDLIPNDKAYHENSEIIGSFLFRLAGSFGLEAALGLVRWMDNQDPSIVLHFETIFDNKNKKVEKGPTVKAQWERVAVSIFEAIEKWSLTQDPELRVWINSEIYRIKDL